MNMKRFMISAIAAMAFAPAMASASEPTAFGISPRTDINRHACQQIEGTTFSCNVPIPNKAFRAYYITTSPTVIGQVCKVTALTEVINPDYTAVKSQAIFNNLRDKLAHVYSNTFSSGKNPTTMDEINSVSRKATTEAIQTGNYEIRATWEGSRDNPKLAEGRTINLSVQAYNSSSTYVSLEYYFGGPGCFDRASEGTEGL